MRMERRQIIWLSISLAGLGVLLGLIVLGDSGLVDLVRLRTERDRLIEKNREIAEKNITLANEIDRLNHDPKYIENVARSELGMIGRDEVVIQLEDAPGTTEKTGRAKISGD